MAIRSEFDYHQPSPEQLVRLTVIRGAYSALAGVLEQCTEPSRYRSLAMTALEESAMWANKSVVLGAAGNRAPAAPSASSNFPMLEYSSDTDASEAADEAATRPPVQSPPTPSHLGSVSP